MFMFLNWKWKLENLKKPARHTENLERPWVSAEPRTFQASISHSKCQGLPNSDISGYQHCMSQTKGGLRSSVHGCFYFSVQGQITVRLPGESLITLTYFRTQDNHVKCHLWMTPWANEAKGGHHTHSHPQLSVLSFWSKKLIFYYTIFPL